MTHALRRAPVAVLAAVALATGAATAGPAAAAPDRERGTAAVQQSRVDRPAFTLTIAHNNDGESGLVPFTVDGAEGEWGGVARFASVVERIERESQRGRPAPGQAGKRGFLLLNSGDNFLAGTAFAASREEGAPFYDAVAVDYLDYDALAIGNHEFDFGPDVLAEFIGGVDDVPFVSANLDVSAEPSLAQYTEDGTLVASTVLREKGVRIGVIGLTTPLLPQISSPRDVEVSGDLVGITQAQVEVLTAAGADIIVLQSHLQDIREEVALASELSGVDAIIGGGGGELLAAPDDLLIPGDTAQDSYPLEATDADGELVPVVTTEGNYGYVGRIVLNFDRGGELLSYDEELSGVERVGNVGPGAVEPDPFLLENVQRPVEEFEAGLAENVLAVSAGAPITLECERADVRAGETNCGNLITDAHLATATALAGAFGVPTPDVAIMNGGGIRGEVDRTTPLTELDTFDLQPFGNFVSVAPEVSREDFRQILEEGVGGLTATGTGTDGAFVSAAGFSYVVDLSGTARRTVSGQQTVAGSRIVSVTLADGTAIVSGGSVVAGDPLSVAGLNFSLDGGDGYPAQEFVTLGTTDQQSLADYLVEDLGGVVAEIYRGDLGRITFL